MSEKLSSISLRAIEILFYALFFSVPLVFAGNTSELFEFNKMWITFAITIAIAFFWTVRIIAEKSLVIKRTPLDIPIALFVLAQIASTVISLDPHTSLWGYYSRFNGGLLSILCYVFLYYAFVSNLNSAKIVKNIFLVSLTSAFIVVLWALPSHFGKDPTCLIFRGAFDVSCWTADFQPKVRIFGTLGQPAWLAAYLVLLIPISLAFSILYKKDELKRSLKSIIFLTLSSLMFLSFLYTRTRSAVLALGVGLIFFFGALILFDKPSKKNFVKDLLKKQKIVVLSIIIFAIIGFFAEIPLSPFDKFSFNNLKNYVQKVKVTQNPQRETVHQTQLGGTDSGKIRLIVWRGAIDVWKNNPIFGTGVETFAYAYYKYRPIEHNLTSEWNFLYNKAHNEYLNYLATTGVFGLLSYLSFIAFFLFIFLATIFKTKNKLSAVLLAKTGVVMSKESQTLAKDPLILSLVAGFITILITNFFGFSVVIMNIYLFLIPLFVLILMDVLDDKSLGFKLGKVGEIGFFGWSLISLSFLVTAYLLFFLFNFWRADVLYALGNNYSKSGEYQQAYSLLRSAVSIHSEPVFQDEVSTNDASFALAIAYSSQGKNATESAQIISQLAAESSSINDSLTNSHPNNILFWKSRVRIFYNLAQIDNSYLSKALVAMKRVYELGGNEASIAYNLGVLYGQSGDSKKAVEILKKTVALKPDYRDAHYALGLFYNDIGEKEKAIYEMEYILSHFSKDDEQAKQSLSAWKEK
ncbi:MAG: tetratricopeptide repeat domain protein [Microgenomates group bacterium GW2011_GWC1_38_14]|nr:MAG: tetratricopeptide repeat domain protein [Microgenomates group bacterium GW2011_GWC1_38_14]